MITEQDTSCLDPASLHFLAVPASGCLLGCLALPAGRVQIIPTLPQGLWRISGAGSGVSSILIYQGESGRPGPPLCYLITPRSHPPSFPRHRTGVAQHLS